MHSFGYHWSSFSDCLTKPTYHTYVFENGLFPTMAVQQRQHLDAAGCRKFLGGRSESLSLIVYKFLVDVCTRSHHAGYGSAVIFALILVWWIKCQVKKNVRKLTCIKHLCELSVLFTESKMLCQPPIITHTVATPQDSPNTTLDPSMRDFNNRLMATAFYASSSSIDSIDRSSVSQAWVSSAPVNLFENKEYDVIK